MSQYPYDPSRQYPPSQPSQPYQPSYQQPQQPPNYPQYSSQPVPQSPTPSQSNVVVNVSQGVSQPAMQPLLVVQPPVNGKATAAMILGLCSFVLWFLSGIPAVVLGHMALHEISESHGTQRGQGQAITGLILGYLAVAGLAICIFCYMLGGLAALSAPQ